MNIPSDSFFFKLCYCSSDDNPQIYLAKFDDIQNMNV
jgi:hypothetical protein